MSAALFAGLFLSLFGALYLFCAPGEEGSYLGRTVDAVRRRLYARLVGGEREIMLRVLGRSGGEVVRAALLIGLALGALALVAWRWLGVLALGLSAAVAVGGIFVAGLALENEYRRWQGRLFAAVPDLVNFLPAFLEAGMLTPREALSHTVPFLSEPLRSEVARALDRIRRKGDVTGALDALAARARTPLMDAVCFRLSAAWETTITPDLFADLADQVEDLKEEAAARATASKSGFLALVCVVGLVGAVLIYGYPALTWLKQAVAGGFGM